jgi:hypothetical protein
MKKGKQVQVTEETLRIMKQIDGEKKAVDTINAFLKDHPAPAVVHNPLIDAIHKHEAEILRLNLLV